MVVPDNVVMVECEPPELYARVTVLLASTLEFASSRVTVIVEVLTPSAVTLTGEATIVDLPGFVVDVTEPAPKVTPTVPTVKFDCVVSVAV